MRMETPDGEGEEGGVERAKNDSSAEHLVPPSLTRNRACYYEQSL